MEVVLSPRATTVQSRLQLNWRNDATSILSQSEEIVPRTTLSSSCQDSRFTAMKIMPNSSCGRSFCSGFVVVREARLYCTRIESQFETVRRNTVIVVWRFLTMINDNMATHNLIRCVCVLNLVVVKGYLCRAGYSSLNLLLSWKF